MMEIERLDTKVTVSKFEEFYVEDDKLMGKVGDETYEIDYILRAGSGDTFVTYFDKDGEKIEILQHEGRRTQSTIF